LVVIASLVYVMWKFTKEIASRIQNNNDAELAEAVEGEGEQEAETFEGEEQAEAIESSPMPSLKDLAKFDMSKIRVLVGFLQVFSQLDSTFGTFPKRFF